MEPLDERAAQAVVKRQEHDLHVWEVQLAGEADPHVVHRIRLADGTVQIFCTCREEDDTACEHVQTLETYHKRRREEAATRRARGLCYTGMRVETRPGLTEGSFLTEEQVFVWEGADMHPLDPRPSQELRNHSPLGYEWGYAGSGPAQLALAILLDYAGDEELALAHYQQFKGAVIAALPREAGQWEIHATQIEQFLAARTASAKALPEDKAAADEPYRADDTRQLHDEIFPYQGHFGCASRCRIRWTTRGDKVVVIATELPENPGTSVTNVAEHLAAAACRQYGFDPERVVWVEHYPGQGSPRQKLLRSVFTEHFSLVSFQRSGGRFSHPQWTRVQKEFVETLIGQPLPDDLSESA